MKSQDVDMDALRRKFLMATWLTLLPFVFMCHLPWYAILRSHGWPDVGLAQGGKRIS